MKLHPWNISCDQRIKLNLARKEAKRRYERMNAARNDEFRRIKRREQSRIRKNIPIDLQKMKPWDFSKRKVSSKQEVA